eukprot:GHVP01035161.1.p1 GENE.GHVP01035161.1~~GHVP01035161.1.p1  ORF type:complete len:150 (-),score=21.66 GHVP01035161.1:774-1223(-)
MLRIACRKTTTFPKSRKSRTACSSDEVNRKNFTRNLKTISTSLGKLHRMDQFADKSCVQKKIYDELELVFSKKALKILNLRMTKDLQENSGTSVTIRSGQRFRSNIPLNTATSVSVISETANSTPVNADNNDELRILLVMYFSTNAEIK